MPRIEEYYKVNPEKHWLADHIDPQTAASVARDAFPIAEELEAVRQWILYELIDNYHFPAEWLGERIVPGGEEDFDAHNFIGFSLLTEDKSPFLYVSVQIPGNGDKAQEALRAILLHQETAGAGISTDGSKGGTKFLRRRFDSLKCDFIVDIEPYKSPRSSSTPKPFMNSSKKDVRHLETLTRRFESLFFEVHSHIRDIDGMHADEALDELCKVVYVKLYDEEATETDKPYRFQRWLYGSPEELAASIRRIFQEACDYDVRVFSLKVPGYKRSRGVFNTSIRLSSPALLKIVEALQNYDIGRSQTDIKGRAFQQVLAPTIRSGMGQYFTPRPVVMFMVEIAEPKITELILDPFSGSGQFLSTCLEWGQSNNLGVPEKLLHEFAFGKLHGIEKSDRMVRVAMTDMRLHGDGHSNIRCTDSLLDFANYPDLQPESFDLILTNPPFGSLLGGEAISQLGEFSLSAGRKAVPLEVLGLERCVQFLQPGGRIGIVLPDGLLANRNSGYVREWLDNNLKLRAIVSLPIETFSPFGANIQTSILFARKWKKGEKKLNNYPVFLTRIDNVGYDAAERAKDGAEFSEAASRIKNFLRKEGW